MNPEIRLGDWIILFVLLGLFVGGLWWWGDYQRVVREEVKRWGFDSLAANCCVCSPRFYNFSNDSLNWGSIG